ncbi:reverse transcriptase-2 [Lasius niger]|uniref:Reverse transcriptase-2 n=1 Tax=Lasius niger TaxID=67767 RepID=A0A0J7KSF7_LASNI|nr:reverse transcriptase-2 [Lasius niger]
MPGERRVNQRVEGVDGELGELRPDLVVRHEPSKRVVICDVTVPFENRWPSFEEAKARKIAKYQPLAEALERQGYRVAVAAFVVGALGSWDPGPAPPLEGLPDAG